MTRKLQKQFEMKLAAEAKSNPKAIWKYINSKTKTRVGVSELNTDPADPTSKLTTSDKEKAEVLGQFFSSVFTTEPDGDIPQIPTINLSNEMEVLVIREENVKEILSGLNSGKSCGPDGIHPRLINTETLNWIKAFFIRPGTTDLRKRIQLYVEASDKWHPTG